MRVGATKADNFATHHYFVAIGVVMFLMMTG